MQKINLSEILMPEFEVEEISLDGMEFLQDAVNGSSKIEQIKRMVCAVLLSSSSFSKSCPDTGNKKIVMDYAGKIKVEKSLKLIDAFMEVNKDFFSAPPQLKNKLMNSLPSNTLSQHPATTPSNTPEGSNIPKPIN